MTKQKSGRSSLLQLANEAAEILRGQQPSRDGVLTSLVLLATSTLTFWFARSLNPLGGILLGVTSSMLGLFAIMILASRLPPSRARDICFLVLGIPWFAATWLSDWIWVGGGVAFVLILLLSVQYAAIAGLSWAFGLDANATIVYYLVAVSTLVLLAYAGGPVLLTLAWLVPSSRSRNPQKNIRTRLAEVIPRIGFRRRAYEIGFLVFVFATIERVADVHLVQDQEWKSFLDVSLEALLTFFVIDQYIATFVMNAEK